MQTPPSRIAKRLRSSGQWLCASLALAAGAALPLSSNAATITLTGAGTFKPPSEEQLAQFPPDLGFTRADLASGSWSFSVRYDDRTADANPDPYVGRYAGAVRSYRLVIGNASIDLPVTEAQITVSDGGGGFAGRESVRIEARSALPSGMLRLSWIQANQLPNTTDLRGAAGSLASDALPPYLAVANLPTASPFDRFLELRVDRPGGGRPLLYLSSSQLSVTAAPASVP